MEILKYIYIYIFLTLTKSGKKNFIQSKSTTVGSYNMGERLSLNLTPVGTQLGFRAKEQGGSMGLQRETRRLQWTTTIEWLSVNGNLLRRP